MAAYATGTKEPTYRKTHKGGKPTGYIQGQRDQQNIQDRK